MTVLELKSFMSSVSNINRRNTFTLGLFTKILSHFLNSSVTCELNSIDNSTNHEFGSQGSELSVNQPQIIYVFFFISTYTTKEKDGTILIETHKY